MPLTRTLILTLVPISALAHAPLLPVPEVFQGAEQADSAPGWLRWWEERVAQLGEAVHGVGLEVKPQAGPAVDVMLRPVPEANLAPAAEVRDTTDPASRGRVSLGVVNRLPELRGASLALIGTWVEREVRGFQLALGANTAGDKVLGGQLAGFHNAAGGALVGGQLSAGVNVAHRGVSGGQVGLLNWSGGPSRGGQLAGVLNVSRELRQGGQVAAVNLAAELIGGQLGVVNVAHTVTGAQLAPVNVASEISGVQLGVLNVAGKARGVQFALVNVARELDGTAIGLVNVIGDGALHLEAYGSDLQPINIAFKSGSRGAFSTLFVGAGREQTFLYGLGGGIHRGDRLWFEADLTAATTHALARPLPFVDVLSQVRVLGGVKVARSFSVFAGPTANVRYEFRREGQTATWVPWVREWRAGRGAVQAWPGLQLGARL